MRLVELLEKLKNESFLSTFFFLVGPLLRFLQRVRIGQSWDIIVQFFVVAEHAQIEIRNRSHF